MNDIEEAHVKKVMDNLMRGFEKMNEGQMILLKTIMQIDKRLNALERPKKFKPKIVDLNGKEVMSNDA